MQSIFFAGLGEKTACLHSTQFYFILFYFCLFAVALKPLEIPILLISPTHFHSAYFKLTGPENVLG